MNDLAKCVVILSLCAGGWLYKDFRGSGERKVDSGAAQGLVMIQGTAPKPGMPVILEFWGTYCGPCIASIPHLNELHEKFGSRVQFVAVSGEDTGTVKAFMANHRMAYPVAVDPSHEFFGAWKVKGIPDLVVLDGNQKQLWRGHSAALTSAKLASLLGEL